jgi:hypothetical protein
MDNRFNNIHQLKGAIYYKDKDNYPSIQCVLNRYSKKQLYLKGLSIPDLEIKSDIFKQGLPNIPKRSNRLKQETIDNSFYAIHKRDRNTPNNIIQRRKYNFKFDKSEKRWSYEKDDFE